MQSQAAPHFPRGNAANQQQADLGIPEVRHRREPPLLSKTLPQPHERSPEAARLAWCRGRAGGSAAKPWLCKCLSCSHGADGGKNLARCFQAGGRGLEGNCTAPVPMRWWGLSPLRQTLKARGSHFPRTTLGTQAGPLLSSSTPTAPIDKHHC